MDIGELIWIFVIIFFLYRLFFAPSKPQQEDRYESPSEPEYEEEKSSTKTRDDILDEMRTIFGEKSTTQKPEPKPTPPPQRTQRTTSPREPVQSGESKYSSYTGTDFVDPRGKMSDADEALKDVVLTSRSMQDEIDAKRHSFEYLFEYNELRKGIIISEILNKPKSMRRHNI